GDHTRSQANTLAVHSAARPGWSITALGIVVLAALYCGSALLGVRLQFEATHATPIWLPSGIALAALLLFGPRLGAGVFLGAFLANLADILLKSKAPTPLGLGALVPYFAEHLGQVGSSAAIGVGN